MKLGKTSCIWLIPLLMVLPNCAPEPVASPAPAPVVSGSSSVSGTVTVTPNCGGGTAQVMMINGNQVLYQTNVMNGGTFQFQAIPGTYSIIAQTQNGCVSQQSITLVANQTTNTAVGLMTQQAGQVGSVPGALPAGYPQTAYPYPSTGYPQVPPIGGYPQGNCTYGGYGCPTGYYSCPWGGYGCQGNYYPGTGGGVAGKPNIYVSAPAGAKIQIKVTHPDDSNLLATVPIHRSGGWTGTVNSDGTLTSGNTRYPFFYYDLRFNPDRIQNTKGYCVEKAALLPSLVSYLKQAGFKANEVSDFQNYWSLRMPPSNRYCVYPQDESNIRGAADLEITPAPDQLTRVWFFIVSDDAKAVAKFKKPGAANAQYASLAAKWFKKPATEYVLAKAKGTPGRSLASTNSSPTPARVEVREWGVGFLVQPDEAKTSN